MYISLIIPAFNVAEHIKSCLDSIFVQGISSDEFEVIIIDDGSSDNTLSLAQQYSKIYSNIKVFTQENSGLSATRNRGLDLAKGKYVWFIDSDDWISQTSLKKLLEKIKEQSADVLHFGCKYSTGSKLKYGYELECEGHISGFEFLRSSFAQSPAPFYSYKLSFIKENNMKFKEGIYHEDNLFTPLVLMKAKSVSFINESFYIYNLREGSITNSNNYKKRFLDLLTVTKCLQEENRTFRKEEQIVISKYISVYFGAVCQHYRKICINEKKDLKFDFDFFLSLKDVLASRKGKYIFALMYLGFIRVFNK